MRTTYASALAAPTASSTAVAIILIVVVATPLSAVVRDETGGKSIGRGVGSAGVDLSLDQRQVVVKMSSESRMIRTADELANVGVGLRQRVVKHHLEYAFSERSAASTPDLGISNLHRIELVPQIRVI